MTDEDPDFAFPEQPDWLVAVSSNGVITLSVYDEEGQGFALSLEPNEARWLSDLLSAALPPNWDGH